jgi:hypothetical protein
MRAHVCSANVSEDPRSEGHLVMKQDVPGYGMVDCVMFRKLAAGHFDLEVEVEVASVLSERHDSGEATLREGQQEAKFKKLSATTASLATQGKDAKVLALPPPTQDAGFHDNPQGGEQNNGDGGKKAADEEDMGSASEEEEWGSSLGGSMLAGYATAKPPTKCAASAKAPAISKGPARAAPEGPPPTGRKAAPAAVVKAAPAKPPAAVPPLAPRVRAAQTPLAAEDETDELSKQGDHKGKGKGRRGKSAKLPSDADELLRQEKFFDVTAKFQKLMDEMHGNPWDTWLTLSKESIKFDKVCADWVAKADKVWKECVLLLDTRESRG